MLRRLLVTALFAVGPLSAQAFEGVITMRMTSPGAGSPMESKTYIKGDNLAMVMNLPGNAGPMAGKEVRMIIDPRTKQMTMLMPMIPGMPVPANTKGMKIVIDLAQAAADAPADVKVAPLGTTQTIAGMRCEDYGITSRNGTMNMCVTTALGRFVSPLTNPMGGGDAPAWTRAFGDRPMFPLKVWDDKGTVAMEVTAVERTTVPATMFVIPDGYMDMSSAMGGMGRRP